MAVYGSQPNSGKQPAAQWAYNPGQSNQQNEWNYFADQGFTPAQDAGILGNFQAESGFNPESVGDANGLAQWLGGRWNPSWMTGQVGPDLTNQLNAVMQQLQGTPSYGLSALQQAQTPQQAALIFGNDFERFNNGTPAAQQSELARQRYASQIDTTATSGNWQQGTGIVSKTPSSPSGTPPQLAQIIQELEAGQYTQALTALQGQQNQYNYGQQGYTNEIQQLQQQYGFQQSQFGLEAGQLGLSGLQLAQQGAQQKTQQGFELESFGQQMNNLIAGYGFTQQQLGTAGQQLSLQNTEAQQQMAGSGLTNTGSHRQQQQSQALQQQQLATEKAQAAQQYGYQKQQLQLGQQSEVSGYGYTQQQLADAKTSLQQQFAQLGLSQTEATAGLNNALVNAGLQNVMTGDQLLTQIALMQQGMQTPLTSVLQQLMQSSPLVSELISGG